MSMRIFKICDESLVKSLFYIFQFSLETGNLEEIGSAVILSRCIKRVIRI